MKTWVAMGVHSRDGADRKDAGKGVRMGEPWVSFRATQEENRRVRASKRR